MLHGLGSVVFGLAVIALLLGGFLFWRVNTKPISMPQVAQYLETAFATNFPDATLTMGEVSIVSPQGSRELDLVMQHVSVQSIDGKSLFLFPSIRTEFSPSDMLRGNFAPTQMTIDGAALHAERSADGTFSFSSATNESSAAITSINEALEVYNTIAFLRNIETVEFLNTDLTLVDKGTGRTYSVENGNLAMRVEDQNFEFNTNIQVNGGNAATNASATLRHTIDAPSSELLFQFSDVSLHDAAEQFPSLQFLAMVDAPVSGSVSMRIDTDTPLGDLNGVLELKQGALTPADATKGFSFEGGKIYFNYQRQDDLLFIDSLTIDSEFGTAALTGTLDFDRNDAGFIDRFSTVLDANELRLNKGRFFANDLSLEAGQILANIEFLPFSADVKKLVVWDETTHLEVDGKSWIKDAQWQNEFHLRSDLISNRRLMEIWPLNFIPKTRAWLTQNVASAEVANIDGNLSTIDNVPDYNLSFSLQDVETTLVKTMPPLKNATGTGELTKKDLTLTLDHGHIIAPNGQKVDMDGTQFYIPDITARPANGEITLRAAGGAQGAMALLNIPKFQFLTKAGLKTDIAEAAVVANGKLRLPLVKSTKPIDFDIDATLNNVFSETLIQGRTLRAKTLNLRATDKTLEISGPAVIDGVDADVKWQQPIGKGSNTSSTVTANFDLGASQMSAFGIALPNGFVSGSTPATMTLNIQRNQPVEFEINSNLRGAEINLPSLGWAKPARLEGGLLVAGTFGKGPKIEKFQLSGNGLTADGTINLTDAGKLSKIDLSTFRLNNWIDSSVTLVPSGANSFKIELSGGTVDLRRSQSAKGGGANTIDFRLDTLVITNGISLTNVRGDIKTKGGITGNFSAKVNGGAVVVGQLARANHGTRIHLTSANTGRLLKSANLLNTASKGDMQLELWPTPAGPYDGKFTIKHIRVKQTNALASLLNAMSGVGLIQQLGGEGIHFATVEGGIKLRPSGTEIIEMSAVGPSMGMTVNGWYKAADKSLDFEGVVTPLYAINGVFERVFKRLAGRQKGEGLFSFTYKMRGPAANPSVNVNPLSILTPGVFRNIFRQPAPTPKE